MCYQSTETLEKAMSRSQLAPGEMTSPPRITPGEAMSLSKEGSRQTQRRHRSRRPSGNSGTSQFGETVRESGLSIRPEAYRPRTPRLQQDTQSGPAPDTPPYTGGTVPELEPTKPGIIIEPATPAPGVNPLSAQQSDVQPKPKDELYLGTNSNSGPDHPHSRSPSPNTHNIPIIDEQVPPKSRSPSLYSASDNDLALIPSRSGETLRAPIPWITLSRCPTAERPPPMILPVEILDYRKQWHSLPVRLDTSLYIANLHDKRGKGREIHYYGIISLRTLIDELMWPEETLLEDPKFVRIPDGTSFKWDSKCHEGIGRVTLTWKVNRSDDEWEIGVIPKMTRECIVSREDPCEQGIVLKTMPAAQNV